VPNTPNSCKNTLIERVMPRRVREVGKSAGPGRAHRVDERIYLSPATRNQSERIRHLSIVSRVCRDSEYVGGAGIANLLVGLIEDLWSTPQNGDSTPVLSKPDGNRQSYTCRSTTDDSRCHAGHRVPPSRMTPYFIDSQLLPSMA
jgi:hypothetical protein